LPLYVKAGAILPIGPVKQYTEEADSEPLKLRVYPGADGVFSLYEDDGSSFRYQHGEFTRIAGSWNDKERNLTLQADPHGQLPKQKIMAVEIVGTPESRQITLSGNAATVQFGRMP
jgi:alpha-glucosidase (family GH31 glycosyl hydrolase)